MIRLKCPYCSKKLKVKDDAAGQHVRCPSCTYSFVAMTDPIGSVPDMQSHTGPLPEWMNERRSPEWENISANNDPRRERETGPGSPRLKRRRSSAAPLWIGLGILGALVFLGVGGTVVVLIIQRLNRTGPNAPAEGRVRLTDEQKAAGDSATKELGRIEAAVQVGVSYQNYSKLVIDAKAATNEASRTLPTCDLRTRISEAMDAYADAGTVWNDKIFHRERGVDSAIIARYELKSDEDPDVALQLIWAVADSKLRAARALQQ